VRNRTIHSKGCLSNRTALAMVFRPVEAGQRSWRRLDGHNQLPKLIFAVKFMGLTSPPSGATLGTTAAA
jgi:hypothetical protein